MKVYETKEVPVTTRTVCVRRVCDLCGVESASSDWKAGNYEVAESEVKVTVKSRTGESYPEGGDGVGYEVDLCPRCFADRLVPWLMSQGAKVEEIPWSW